MGGQPWRHCGQAGEVEGCWDRMSHTEESQKWRGSGEGAGWCCIRALWCIRVAQQQQCSLGEARSRRARLLEGTDEGQRRQSQGRCGCLGLGLGVGGRGGRVGLLRGGGSSGRGHYAAKRNCGVERGAQDALGGTGCSGGHTGGVVDR